MVGWSFAENMTASLVINALNMALITRKPDKVIHHSDQGNQARWFNAKILRYCGLAKAHLAHITRYGIQLEKTS